ncbi:hypothetical protein [Rhodoferax sp.]|uniref:hypothetical protein n=1 Tax=Rhodoferax sp. TaxID=50421 RepID=UPI0027508730|nr:CopG family transcriptional regulator [Rhodoferax sp.]
MAVSVRMDPLLEKQLEQAAKRQGVTKSQFIIDAVERALGHKDPYQLLLQVREEFAPYHVTPAADDASGANEDAAPPRKQRLHEILRAKHNAELADWEAYQAAKSKGQDGSPT